MFLPAFIAIAVLQNSFALPTTHSTTHTPNPVDDLYDILPKKELLDLKAKHLHSDPGYQAALKYFKSPEWVKIVEDARKTPEWIAYKTYLQEAGFDLDYLIKHVEHCINASNIADLKVEGVKPSLTSFIEELKASYGVKILQGIHEYLQKLGTTDAYKKLLEKVTCPKSKELLEKALEQASMKKMIGKLKEIGINIDSVVEMLYSLGESNPFTTEKP